MKTIKLYLSIVILCTLVSSSKAQGVKYLTDDTLSFIIKSDIFRYISGTAHLGVEVPFKNNRYSVYGALLGTYYTTGENIQRSGPGIEIQFKDYIGKYSGPTKFPVYFGIQLMGRHVVTEQKFEDRTVWNYPDNTSTLVPGYTTRNVTNIYYGGIILGYQQFIRQAISLDFYFGGGLRLTYDAGEKSPTKFKTMTDFDYSGVMPKAGVIIGILQR